MEAKIVLGTQFGDEGKGRTVDYLCWSSPNPIVVRFSGGQQVGHTVIHNGIKHIHANFGSGTLRGIPTYYTEYCTAYLTSISIELEILKEKGILPEVYYHPLVKMTTPYDQAYNRLKESKDKHGSCGMGIGTTMKRHLETGYKLYAMDMKYPAIAKAKLKNIEQYYLNLVQSQNYDVKSFVDLYWEQEQYFLEQIDKDLLRIENYEFLYNYHSPIFEGSQGILLDMDHGIFPNVTYANTTSKNAIDICKKLKINPEIYYVTRCYQTRHGNGWMSKTGDINLVNNEEEINVTNEWQGNFRIQEIDYDLINYALDIDANYCPINTPKNIVVTCLDQRPEFKFDYSRLKGKLGRKFEFSGPSNNFPAELNKSLIFR